MRSPCVDAALRELEAVGIRDVEVTRGAKHPQLRFRVNGGPLHVFAVSGTPSDWRSVENTKHELRRLLRELGVLVEPTVSYRALPCGERPGPSPRPAPKPDRFTMLEQRVQVLEDLVRTIQEGEHHAQDPQEKFG